MKYTWYDHFNRVQRIVYKRHGQPKPSVSELATTRKEYDKRMSNNVDDLTAMEESRINLAFPEGHHLAVDSHVIEQIEASRLSKVEGQSLHFAHRNYNLGFREGFFGKNVKGVKFSWLSVNDVVELGWKPNPDEMHRLYVYVDYQGSDDGLSSSLSKLSMTDYEITEFINSGKINEPVSTSELMGLIEQEILKRIARLIIKLAVILSIDESKLMPLFGKDLPKEVKRGSKLHWDIGVTERRTAHFIVGHIRQLSADRYYKGEWASYPKGTRYSFVSSHVRGKAVDDSD